MKKDTGFDFRGAKYAWEREKHYQEAAKNGDVSYEPFATVVLQSIGRQSLAEPLHNTGSLPPPEWNPLSMNVAIFFQTMPPAFYKTFKRIVDHWSDMSSPIIKGFRSP
jgi:hypothetical protein